jgi:hypothetical protein
VTGQGEVGKAGRCSVPTGHRKPRRCLKFAYDITRHDTGEITGELTIECPRRDVTFRATAFPELSIARFTALFRATGVLGDGRLATADVLAAANDELNGTTDEFGVKIYTSTRTVCEKRGTLALGDIEEPAFP